MVATMMVVVVVEGHAESTEKWITRGLRVKINEQILLKPGGSDSEFQVAPSARSVPASIPEAHLNRRVHGVGMLVRAC